MISLIVAASTNNAIGKNNQLLWHLPADMKFFKNTTWALPVIMGRKTYEALGKPLSGRFNIVITNNSDFNVEGVEIAGNLNDAIAAAEVMKSNEVMIIGGGQVYKESLPIANRVYLTRVHAILEGDTYFPELNKTEWKLVSEHNVEKDEKHAYAFTFEIWDRV
ncbi:MAG: dihydrofolate reductase [Bacteroidota bacterium]